MPELPDIDREDSLLNLFDQGNPDINLFNLVDDEIIRLGGSRIRLYPYNPDRNFDPVYMEARDKPISDEFIILHGHYDPVSMSENLTQFGIELTNDQLFTFNKSNVERKLGRSIAVGDVLKPEFQDQKYEVFEVVEDGFESYGVYHLVCSAKLLRDSKQVVNEPLTKVDDPLPGYAGGLDDY